MDPWKIVLQPQKVSTAARVSGWLESIRETPSNCFYNLLNNQSHFCMKFKNIHCIDISITSTNW